MKRITYALLILVFAASCTKRVVVNNSNSKSVPPGQMKKMTGSQSAKPYAPGQQKKASTGASQKSSGKGNGNQKKKN